MFKKPLFLLLVTLLVTSCALPLPPNSSLSNASNPTTAPQSPPKSPAVVEDAECPDAVVVTRFDFDHLVNTDDGDPFNYWVNFVSADGFLLLTFGEPMTSIDIEANRMVGESLKVQANDLDAAACVANQVAAAHGDPYLYFVGTNPAPDGFTKDAPSNVFTKTWPYELAPIEPGGTWSDPPLSLAVNDAARTFGDKTGYTYFQFYNPKTGDTVHWVVAPSWEITAPLGFQGTGWINWGGDQELLFERFLQASNEVWERDDHPTIVKLFCGPADAPKPDSWASSSAWSCQELEG